MLLSAQFKFGDLQHCIRRAPRLCLLKDLPTKNSLSLSVHPRLVFGILLLDSTLYQVGASTVVTAVPREFFFFFFLLFPALRLHSFNRMHLHLMKINQ